MSKKTPPYCRVHCSHCRALIYSDIDDAKSLLNTHLKLMHKREQPPDAQKYHCVYCRKETAVKFEGEEVACEQCGTNDWTIFDEVKEAPRIGRAIFEKEKI